MMEEIEVLPAYRLAEVSRITVVGKVKVKRLLRKPKEIPVSLELVTDNVMHSVHVNLSQGLEVEGARHEGLQLSFSLAARAYK